jgi:hypothetical protein
MAQLESTRENLFNPYRDSFAFGCVADVTTFGIGATEFKI